MQLQHISNRPAVGAPFFTPAQELVAGTALNPQPDGKTIPRLFVPLKIRDITFQNRIFLAPLCQYSAEDGHVTPWHLAHLGGIISRGPGLSFVEATAVTPTGRITSEDVGIWNDSHIAGLKQIVDFAHSQGQNIGIQLAHAGRKASTVAPWLHSNYPATPLVGGHHDAVGPSAISYDEINQVPKELSQSEIKEIIIFWAQAAKRAVRAGFDVIEVHGAHGFLLHSFNSPVSNKRTDEYGGSFENRIRLLVEVVDALRAVMPEGMPLFVRVSASDRMERLDEPSWTLADTIRLAPILSAHGVDLLDVSSAGSSLKQNLQDTTAHQKFSKAIKQALSDSGDAMLVSTVGGIKSAVQAEGYLQDGIADVTFVGRQFQRNPALVWHFADELNIRIHLAVQMWWPFYGRVSRRTRQDLNI
ncbi:NADH:flavin oxidoreductase/NADH oxidase [Lentinula aciculospora]|uniref:NADH:flavin oxidoreductase/NADH oxidase n=1 Tax=Lentinula aciculospora TaxID=153920 RepID=A0A9W8ZZN7_9AGAR|nr:NADH:flavin oxidoreductase/NADH oxidase [Lentinula aciculospora]